MSVPAPRGPSPRCVRTATHGDLAAVVEAVGELLHELGSEPPAADAMQAAARALIDDPEAGALLVATDGTLAGAQDGGAILGVLGASFQTAMHAPGRYALIQDLWVAPSWRGRAIGAELLAALFALVRERNLARVEVGLPRERYAGLEATEAFYRANGFAPLGARMRWLP
jgi:GNAT superfamily N-acetyltransferase